MNSNKSLFEIDLQVSLHTYARFPIAIAEARGTSLIDIEGRVYLDMFSGLSVCNLGHNHPGIVDAIKSQTDKVLHTSNYFITEPQLKLASALVEKSGMNRVFFANSGAEAVEGAYKIARKYAHLLGKGGEIIALEHSFHGRTLATIATGKERHRKGFGPMPKGFHKVPIHDLEALKSAINDKTAAIIIEPVQGEGGVIPVEKKYLQAVKEICESENIALIFDEIQCGMGRTGYLFAWEYYGIKPDIITLAKSLGGGVPISAILVNEKYASAISPGDHGSTFGGNALACAAGLKSLELLGDENLLKEVTEKGDWLLKVLKGLQEKYDSIRDVRGRGLMIGVELDRAARPLVDYLLEEHKIVCNVTSETVLRLLPALIITRKELVVFLEALEEGLKLF